MSGTNGETSQRDSESNTQSRNLSDQEKEFVNKCKKYSWLDGKFFEVNLSESNINRQLVAAQCKTCDKVVKGKVTVSSNFKNHLKRSHENEMQEYVTHKKVKLDETASLPKRFTCKFSQSLFETNVTNYILESHAPFNTVEKPSFKKIFDDLDIKKGGKPSLKHLTRHKIIKKIDDIYNSKKKQIMDSMDKSQYVCLTADAWSGSNRRFLGVTAHWLDAKNLNRESAALACRRFTGTHSYDNIARLLAEICFEYSLPINKIIATVTDNGSNFIKAFKEFGINDKNCFEREYSQISTSSRSIEASEKNEMEVDSDAETSCSEEEEEEEFQYTCKTDEDITICTYNIDEPLLSQHFRCASHTLNLIATTDFSNALKSNGNIQYTHELLIKKCNYLWKSMSYPKMRESLIEYLGCSLPRPNDVRWNSLFDSLSAINAQKEKLCSEAIIMISRLPDAFSEEDFQFISEYLEWSKPLANAIDKLQAEKHCYYGYLLPTIIDLRRKWQNMCTNNTKIRIFYPILTELLHKLEERFFDFFNASNNGEYAAMAALLHPKFKASWVHCLSEDVQKKIVALSNQLVEKEKDQNNTIERNNIQTEEDAFDFGESNSFVKASYFVQGEEEMELKKFLNVKSSSFDVFGQFPKMKELFIKFNSIIPSSAPVERMFSQATLLDLPKFNKLSDKNFEKRVLCKINLSNSK